jgi:hypothetical protein
MLHRASAASTRAKTAERSGGATENRQKSSKIRFNFGRLESGSDALIAGQRFLIMAENP